MTQRAQILSDLKRGKSITAIDALRDYGCFRLAARIEEIRGMGYQVEMDWQRSNGKRFGKYYLK